jgi:hypothetical protein
MTPDSTEGSSIQRRLQFAILIQLDQKGRTHWSTLAAACPGADQRDFTVALDYLLHEGAIEGWTERLEPLPDVATNGFLRLTDAGRQRLAEDDI